MYDPKTMRNQYWSRERGFANSGTAERLLVAWKGRTPRCFPTNRQHCDIGSSTYLDVLRGVPVVPAAELTQVNRETWDNAIKAMGTEPAAHVGDGEDEEADEAPAESQSARIYTKRGTNRALHL